MFACQTAQRRPERQPRLHVPTGTVTREGMGSAQRRPERQPRLHPETTRISGSPPSLNEGRSVNPGYTRPSSARPALACTLNEGRSVNPGYTIRADARWDGYIDRSTKAGASTPATPRRERAVVFACQTAQRRPERQPRLHDTTIRFQHGHAINAQRRPERQPRLHVPVLSRPMQRLHRSTKAGASLNEGRSVNPGDTCRGSRNRRKNSERSTKAGASTPATH